MFFKAGHDVFLGKMIHRQAQDGFVFSRKDVAAHLVEPKDKRFQRAGIPVLGLEYVIEAAESVAAVLPILRLPAIDEIRPVAENDLLGEIGLAQYFDLIIQELLLASAQRIHLAVVQISALNVDRILWKWTSIRT